MEEVDPGIVEAIEEAVKAGVFWRAARWNPKTAKTWQSFADLHHERAATLLDGAMIRLAPGRARPGTR